VHRDLDQLSVATIRTLAMDAVPPVAYVLWQRFLRYDPDDPVWPNRDRLVLSNGHASMLLFEQQPAEYRANVLPPGVKASVAVEQASTLGWNAIVSTASALLERGEG
jgi:transketolase